MGRPRAGPSVWSFGNLTTSCGLLRRRREKKLLPADRLGAVPAARLRRSVVLRFLGRPRAGLLFCWTAGRGINAPLSTTGADCGAHDGVGVRESLGGGRPRLFRFLFTSICYVLAYRGRLLRRPSLDNPPSWAGLAPAHSFSDVGPGNANQDCDGRKTRVSPRLRPERAAMRVHHAPRSGGR